MKVLYLAIITAAGIVAIIIPTAVFFFPSAMPGTYQHAESNALDLSGPTTDNPLGITASVVVEQDTSMMCPVKCTISPTPHLVLRSHSGAEFVGYRVCDGGSCKTGRLSDSINASLESIPQNYSGPTGLTPSDINLGDLPWQVGDTVHVIVKAFPVALQPNDILVRQPERTAVVDLGESKITGLGATEQQDLRQINQASIRKIVDLAQLNRTLAERPIDNFVGIIFGAFDWSHDGKFLVFSTNAGNPPSYLWVMSSDGKQTRIISTPKADSIYSPRISPDNRSVYYIGGYSQNGTWYQDIYRCGLENDSNNCQDLTLHSKIGAFDFIPSGNGLVFVENHSNTTFVRSFTFLVRHYNLLWLSDLDGKKQKLLFNGTQTFSGMSLSPDGNSMVFFDRDNPVRPEDNGTYMEYNLPGGGIPGPKPVYLALFSISQKNFTILDSSTDYVYGNFRWTNDGNYIMADKLFSSEMVEVKPEAYSSAGVVTLIPASDPKNQTVLYGLQTKPYAPTPKGLAISPDQKSIIFGIDTDYHGSEIQGRGIYRIDFGNPLP
ncbi:MAG: PD40 domain-containing protein [Thaumarchaeota archaeon]|nr:PD40 domain-containing protein [Nitrososphaerota archaeon]